MKGLNDQGAMLAWLKKQWDVISAPKLDWAQVEVTTHCDSRCLYCPHTLLGPRWPAKDMPLDLFRSMLPFLRTTDLIFLQGWGDPLCHKELFEMIRLCKARGHRVGFTTNGMGLTPQTAQRLVDLQLDILAVSLAGTAPETHDRFRRGTCFDRLVAHLKDLRRIKAQRASALPAVHLAYLMLRSNLQDLLGLPDLAEQVGAQEVVASHLTLILRPELRDEALVTNPQQAPFFREITTQAWRKAARKGLHLAVHPISADDPAPACPEHVLRACVINVEGRVSPCVFLNPLLAGGRAAAAEIPTYCFEDRILPLEGLSFGDLREESLTRVWNRAGYRAFRSRLSPLASGQADAPRRPNLPRRCRTCYKRLTGPAF